MSTTEQLWTAFQSVYEEGSRTAFDPFAHPDVVEALHEVAAFGVAMALEELVRRDAFSERTVRILDELETRVAACEFETDLIHRPSSGSGMSDV